MRIALPPPTLSTPKALTARATIAALPTRAAGSPPPVKTPRVHLQTGNDPAILGGIAKRGVNLCVWTRRPQAPAAAAIRAILSARKTLSLDLVAPTSDVIAAEIIRCIEPAVGPVRASIRSLAEDVADLVARFRNVTKTQHPRVRLNRVEDDCCALFHVDSLRARLLCTYAGPGTQWLGNDNVRRAELGSQGRTIEEATRAIVVNPEAINTVPTWHVAVLKGSAWPDEEGSGIVHRSAPVRDASGHRLVLCIDLPTACSC